jgi:hypothetical protein
VQGELAALVLVAVFRMLKDKAVSENTGSGQVTLGHLLLGIALCMPVSMGVTELKHSGGGILRYVIVAPSALVIGALIVSFDWTLGKAVWLRCRRYSNKAQNRAAMALFGLQLLWIVIGAIAGFKLATFVAAHLPR